MSSSMISFPKPWPRKCAGTASLEIESDPLTTFDTMNPQRTAESSDARRESFQPDFLVTSSRQSSSKTSSESLRAWRTREAHCGSAGATLRSNCTLPRLGPLHDKLPADDAAELDGSAVDVASATSQARDESQAFRKSNS